MADVRPLRGLRYAPEVVADLAEVVTPPFDVISPEAQERYYARNPYNIVRAELGKITPEDSTLNNRYTRAARTLAEWRQEGVLRQDAEPAYYAYQQIFQHGGRSYTRTSLFARVHLEPWEKHVVLRHEFTRKKDKDDRLQLLRACSVNLSPIMSMYSDPQGRIRRLLGEYLEQPAVQLTDEAGEQHRLHPVTDPAVVARIQDFFAERQLYIADGHHRYETALNYRNEILAARQELADDDPVNFVMMSLIDLDDPGMLVLPTHRLLTDLSPERLANLTSENLGRYLDVRELATVDASSLSALAEAGESAPSFLLATPERGWLLSVNERGLARMREAGHSEAWKALDVSIAHTLVLEELLFLQPEDLTAGKFVYYTHEDQEAFEALAQGRAQAALFLNATRVRQICDIADADDQMPQKSTYFYPKLITGLVFNPLW
ncbi:MAG TPA: DUF1015 domain-containing protein [Ktedonobacteraceae bacterium]|jgi:uncharacterized protein (DUF1015 family)|nr:DUF1015 domain-containing protein [Ktedonobacteraceae bacterium]